MCALAQHLAPNHAEIIAKPMAEPFEAEVKYKQPWWTLPNDGLQRIKGSLKAKMQIFALQVPPSQCLSKSTDA